MLTDWLTNLSQWLYPADSGFPSFIPLAIFFCALFFIEALYLFTREYRNQNEKRIKERLKYIRGLEHKTAPASLIKADMLPKDYWKQVLFRNLNRFFNLDELLLQADVPWTTGTFLIACLVMGTIAATYGFFQFGSMGAVGGFLGLSYLLPKILLTMKKRHRLKKFEKQLPEALGLMARSLKAGHSFPSSIQLVSEEMANPIGLEFFKTFKEYNYGMDFNEVMLNLHRRNQLPDLKFFITAILIQRETGGNLVELLEKIAALIRERFKLVNQIQAMTAEGRLSGIILIALPICICLILERLNPQYIGLLWKHPTGRLMTGIAIFFQLLGVITIHKIVSIKV
jgi:tight adherence protein B